MAAKKLAWNATARVATVLATNAAIPTGSISLGNFTHADPTDELSRNEFSHVIYHHVRDMLYRAYKLQDMQRVSIVNTTL